MAEPKAEAVDIKLDIKTEIKTEPKPFVAAGLAHTSSQSPRTDGSQTFPATKNLLQKAKQVSLQMQIALHLNLLYITYIPDIKIIYFWLLLPWFRSNCEIILPAFLFMFNKLIHKLLPL